MGRENVLPDGRIPSAAVHAYVAEYATKLDLWDHILLGTEVKSVQRVNPGQHWAFTVGSGEIFQNEKVIAATGLISDPFIPKIPGLEDFSKGVIHTKQLEEPEVLGRIASPTIRTVTVYGGSKSAFDTVCLLLQAGKKVH